MKNLGYYNGEIGAIEDIKIPMTDRAIYFGDGVYDVAFAVNKKAFALDEHIDRFYQNCKLLNIPFDMDKSELKDIFEDMIQKEDSKSQSLYWQVSRGTALRDHAFPQDSKPNLLIMVKESPMKDVKNLRYSLLLIEDTRFLHCNIKSLNLIPTVLASEKAAQAGCNEAILYRDGYITECSHSNVAILKDGVFKTAPANNLILPGVARAHLIKFCKDFEIPVVLEAFTIDELMDSDEVIVCSSSALCMGVDKIDGKPVGGKAKELLEKLQDACIEEFVSVCGSMS